MRLTAYELNKRREEISTLERIGALREAGFTLIVEFASRIKSDEAPIPLTPVRSEGGLALKED
jgi:hypothetical protein